MTNETKTMKTKEDFANLYVTAQGSHDKKEITKHDFISGWDAAVSQLSQSPVASNGKECTDNRVLSVLKMLKEKIDNAGKEYANYVIEKEDIDCINEAIESAKDSQQVEAINTDVVNFQKWFDSLDKKNIQADIIWNHFQRYYIMPLKYRKEK